MTANHTAMVRTVLLCFSCLPADRFDSDSSGSISQREFSKGLKEARRELEEKTSCAWPALEISDEQIAALFHKCVPH